MKNIHIDLKKQICTNALPQLVGFSEFTYDMHGVEIEVNRHLIPITSSVKKDITENRNIMEVFDIIRFWSL